MQKVVWKEIVTVVLLLLAAGFCENMCDSPVAFVGAWACLIAMAAMWLPERRNYEY